MECHVGDHIQTPFPLDAILDSDARMRYDLDFRRCGNVEGVQWTLIRGEYGNYHANFCAKRSHKGQRNRKTLVCDSGQT